MTMVKLEKTVES